MFHNWPIGVDWTDYELPASLNVADIACGTGTLLMAVAAEVQRRHEAAGGQNAARLHRAMVEQSLYGYDVQLSAVHFAATSLAMLNPGIRFDRMHLYTMPLGAQGDDVRLGSLEFIGSSEAPVQGTLGDGELGIEQQEAEQVSGTGLRGVESGVTATLPVLDLAIMNAPFTRSDKLLFGMMPTGELGKIKGELRERATNLRATMTAGLGAPFVAAVAPKIRRGEGRLALVLPVSVCTGRSWQQTRALIEQDFLLDLVITSHDPERWNFSDSTDLSEALLIATRRAKDVDQGEHRTTFVNLWRNSAFVLDAHQTAGAIETTVAAKIEGSGDTLLRVDGREVGEMVSVPPPLLHGRMWTGAQFARASVLRCALSLLSDGQLRVPGAASSKHVPLCTLREIAGVGPDRRRLVDGFDRTASVTAFPMVERNESDERTSLTCEPNKWLSPLVKPKGGQKPGYGERLRQMAARLLVAERMWLNTVRVPAMWVNRPVLSNSYWELNVGDESLERALALWFNSSLGLLTLLATRNTTRGPWTALKKGDL